MSEMDMAILVYYPGGPARVHERYTLEEVMDAIEGPLTESAFPRDWVRFNLVGGGTVVIRRDSVNAIAEVPEGYL